VAPTSPYAIEHFNPQWEDAAKGIDKALKALQRAEVQFVKRDKEIKPFNGLPPPRVRVPSPLMMSPRGSGSTRSSEMDNIATGLDAALVSLRTAEAQLTAALGPAERGGALTRFVPRVPRPARKYGTSNALPPTLDEDAPGVDEIPAPATPPTPRRVELSAAAAAAAAVEAAEAAAAEIAVFDSTRFIPRVPRGSRRYPQGGTGSNNSTRGSGSLTSDAGDDLKSVSTSSDPAAVGKKSTP